MSSVHTETQLTDWIPADTPPVRVGVYEVDDEDGVEGPWWAYWDGRKFCYRNYMSPQVAFDLRGEHTACAARTKWRGLRRWVLEVHIDWPTPKAVIGQSEPMPIGYDVRYVSYGLGTGYIVLSEKITNNVFGFDSKADAEAFAVIKGVGRAVAVLP